jgi:EAL domain-containing protein (putative c-di-GMP-specific phosphodiesterase class I)
MSRLTGMELCTALVTGSLDVHYQPIATWSGEGAWEIGEVEALLRCRRAGGERIGPERVLPIAERAGLIGQLTHHVLTSALGQLDAWQEQGLYLQVAVNLHAESLTDARLADKILALLDARRVDPHRLTLEVSECSPIVTLEPARVALRSLRSGGVRIALDDFGTGFALFTRLDSLPCDAIKIDKSLTLAMAHSQEAEDAVGALIELGHAHGLQVCIEGVEDAAALETVGNLNGDCVQGYLLSAAVPGAEIAACVADWRAKPASRLPRHFHQQTLPGIPSLADPSSNSGMYLALKA